MATIETLQVGNSSHNFGDTLSLHSALQRQFIGYTSTTDGTTTSQSSDMQVMLPVEPSSGNARPVPGFGKIYYTSNSNFFSHWTYTVTGKIFYGIQVKQAGTYLISYNCIARCSVTSSCAIGLMKTNTSFALSGGLNDPMFSSIVPYQTATNVHYSVGKVGYYDLAANDILIFGVALAPNSTTKLSSLYLGYDENQGISVIHLK